jgi:hypothetical protein
VDQKHFDILTHSVSGFPSRRHLLRGLAAAGLGLGVARLPDLAAAKNRRKRKPKSRKGLCQKNGSACSKPGKNCKQQYCLRAPFTIEARWTESSRSDHDAFLFVPPEDATTGPAPHIYWSCTPTTSTCEEAYPFACLNQDAYGPGDEITTIHQLLPGTYEYWVRLYQETPVGEVTIVLKDGNGRIVREWANPANPSTGDVYWHVFDFDGATGRVSAFDDRTPQPVPLPTTDVCPYNA